MGFSSRSSKQFVGIFNGDFEVRCQPGTDPAIKHRKDKNGKDVYARYYDSYDGRIMGAEIRSGPFGEELKIEMEDIIITVPVRSKYGGEFLRCCPNIDISEPVEFKRYKFVPKDSKDGKELRGWTITQGSDRVPHKFTRESGVIPPMVETVVKGAKVWDDTEQVEWLKENCFEPWISSMHLAKGDRYDTAAASGPPAYDPSQYDPPGPDDDIPF